jgi:1,4-dihydroxy-2-naphthoate polyprenyltransferase
MKGLVSQLGAFIRLGRPVFLIGGLVFHGLGAAIAAHAGTTLDWTMFAWGQLGITAIQLMTHYSNDYFDFEADRANGTPTRWSGGSRVLPRGELPRVVALVAALVLAAIAVLVMAVLHFKLHAPVAALAPMLLALPLSWAYSAPPFRLHSSGLGEVTTAVVVTGLTPLTGFTLQTGHLARTPLLAIAPLVFLQFAMLLAVEFPDAASDLEVGKRTLVVRIGAPAAARLYLAVLLATYGTLPLLTALGLPRPVAIAVGAAVPIAALQAWRAARGAWRDPAQHEGFVFGAVALLVLTATAELIAFAMLSR